MIDTNEIETMFTYHPPKSGQPEKYKTIRDKAKELATVIFEMTPDSREQAIAYSKLDEVVMWANAAIARRE